MEEDETSLFHKDNQNGNHMQWVNIVDGAQFQETTSKDKKGKLLHGDCQREDNE